MDPKNHPYRVIVPRTEAEQEKYYHLRWEVLREPWNQPRGSEREEGDATAAHGMILDESGEAVAVGRLHMNSGDEAQIRFMGVRGDRRGNGLGERMLGYLEDQARKRGAATVVLQAREIALPFYKRNGYAVIEKTYLLFDDIQHYLMKKNLRG